jgi:hypothetical protein
MFCLDRIQYVFIECTVGGENKRNSKFKFQENNLHCLKFQTQKATQNLSFVPVINSLFVTNVCSQLGKTNY